MVGRRAGKDLDTWGRSSAADPSGWEGDGAALVFGAVKVFECVETPVHQGTRGANDGYVGDHRLLPGITAGDIGDYPDFLVDVFLMFYALTGPKALGGYSPTDNGFARFNRVRIPKENMLSQFAQVTDEGTYVQPPHAKLGYGSVSSKF